MVDNLLLVGTQVFVLFILIGLGYFGGKIKLLNKSGVKCMNDVMLYFVTPCVIINVFQREFDKKMLANLLLSMVASMIAHVVAYLLALLFVRNKDESKGAILRFGAVFSNCGFMALPLIEALLGDEGLFYAAGYLAVFNICVWTFGQYIMSKGKGDFSLKKAFLNPGVIAVAIGLVMFFTSCTLPQVIGSPIAFLSELNTPVPMLIIGYTISTIDLKELIKIKELVPSLVIRLVFTPLLVLLALYLIGVRDVLLVASIVSASTPVAAITTMFAIKFDADEKLASKLVAVSTLFSLVTMIVIVAVTSYLSGGQLA